MIRSSSVIEINQTRAMVFQHAARLGTRGARYTRIWYEVTWRLAGPVTRAEADQGIACLSASVEANTKKEAIKRASRVLGGAQP